ncbi:MAG: HDIG domain-containing protein [Candidatus Pacebacteria bacterium]|nr:HDIG domain-containing protein [Candidatus Paceibacterota bacterium]
MSLPTRLQAQKLLKKYIKSNSLIHHCEMVAAALEAYAQKLSQDKELWYQAGLLHDLDWEMYPNEHPHKATQEILPEAGYPQELIQAIKAHAPSRTGKNPESLLECYLFACDELAGLMHAVSLMRPNGFQDMKYKSVKKKLKDKSFAAKVSREDIKQGFELIKESPQEHVDFLITVFKNQ